MVATNPLAYVAARYYSVLYLRFTVQYFMYLCVLQMLLEILSISVTLFCSCINEPPVGLGTPGWMPYLSEYEMRNFSRFVIWHILHLLINSHKVKCTLCRYCPENLKL
jgi:hypothetical protein